MSNVLLVQPNSPFLVDARTFPPLGLLYLGTALEASGHSCSVVDLAFNTPLSGHSPDLIGIMCLTPHFPQMPSLLARLRLLYPSVPIAVGGAHFSTVPEDARRIAADYCCKGDGEEVILELLTALPRAKREGEVFQSPGGITDVNLHPLPARHLLPVQKYRYQIAGTPATTAITQRGCPYECTFCCHWEGYRKVRLRHTDNIVREVQEIKRLGFGAVMLFDDELNLNHKRTLELCDAIQGENIKWRAFVKANLFNEEQAKAFAAAGCWELCTGVESGSDAILKTIQKKATVADNTRARRLCKENGIRFKAFCMVGHPGETRETAYATRDWLIANAPDELNVSLFTPYLGTPSYDRPQDFDLNFDKADYSTEEYFYRGRPGEYQAHTSTSSLSGPELAALRDEIENTVRSALNLPTQGSAATFYTTARTHDEYREEECRG